MMKPNGSLRTVDMKEHSWTLVRISSGEKKWREGEVR